MRIAHWAAFTVLAVAACSDKPASVAAEDAGVVTPPRPIGPYDTTQFLADLATKDVRVSTIDTTPGLSTQCSLSGARKTLRINGETLNVYELPDPTAATTASAAVGCAGDVVNGCILEWNSEPHYFVRGRIVVEHVGTNGTAETLRTILGAPFAGEGSACLDHLRAEVTRANDQIARGDVGAIHGIARNARGRAEDLLDVRIHRDGWSGVERTGWAPYGKPRKRGEMLATGVPAGKITVDVSRFEPNAKVLWTREVDVIAGRTAEIDVRLP